LQNRPARPPARVIPKAIVTGTRHKPDHKTTIIDATGIQAKGQKPLTESICR